MKRSFIVAALLILMSLSASAQKTQQNYVIGFYNLENLFDIYDDPVKNDNEFLPEGKNKWTQAKYEKKLHNMAKVIRAMADNNKRWHTILGISEIENRLVIEDLVSQPEIADANYEIVHYDSPDRRGVLCSTNRASSPTSTASPFRSISTPTSTFPTRIRATSRLVTSLWFTDL